jgi:hypothetical protein
MKKGTLWFVLLVSLVASFAEAQQPGKSGA